MNKKKLYIANRMQLYDYIRTTMGKALEARRMRKFDLNETTPKLYVLETYNHYAYSSIYERIFQELREKEDNSISVNEAEAGSLIEMKFEDSHNKSFRAYLDFGFFYPSERFVAFFSLGRSSDTDNRLKKLIQSQTILDFMWLDNEDAENVSNFIGAKFRSENILSEYNNYSVFEIKSTENRGKETRKKILEEVKKKYPIYNRRFWKGGNPDYTTLDIYYSGKTIFWGEDFDFVSDKVREIQSHYEENLNRLEKYVAKVPDYESDKEGMHIRFSIDQLPTPIDVYFDKEIDIHKVSKIVLSGRMPFRIWGIPMEEEENYIYSFAFDKHIGKGIGIEFCSNEKINNVTRNRVSLYLYNNTCTNTIKRFVSNFRRFIDPNAGIIEEDLSKQDNS